jgi:clan AA aspartic protease (TIGR02281 family)
MSATIEDKIGLSILYGFVIPLVVFGSAWLNGYSGPGEQGQPEIQAPPGPGQVTAEIDDNNHCVVIAYASAHAGSGARIPVILDSGLGGALWLTRSDAQSIGVDVDALDFNERYYSISGTGRSARATISRFRIGGVWLRNVPALVISEDGGMDVSLVGAPILKLLNFRIGGNACVLSW